MIDANGFPIDIAFQKLYTDELPSFINTLKSIDNLPDSMLESLSTVEKNIEQQKTLLSPSTKEGLAGLFAAGAATGLGGLAGGIFGKLQKKQQIKKLSGKRLVAIQDNATHFNDTIARMQQLLGKGNGMKPDYKQLSPQEQQELLVLAEEMKTLSEELSEELAA